MSKLLSYFMLSAVTVVLVACQNDGGGGGGGDTIGTTPSDCLAKGSCADLSAYGAQYAYQRGADNRYVGWNNGYRQNFCGCGPGYRPASTINYDSLSCIPLSSVPQDRHSHGSMMSVDPLIATWNPGTFTFTIGYVVTPYGAAVGYQAGWSGPMMQTGLAPHVSYQRDEYGTPYGTTRSNHFTQSRYSDSPRPWASAPRNSVQSGGGNKCYSNVAITCHEVNRGSDCGISSNGRYRRCLPVSGLPRGIGVCSQN